MSKLMKSKAVWAALAGLAMALATLFGALGDAQANYTLTGYAVQYTTAEVDCKAYKDVVTDVDNIMNWGDNDAPDWVMLNIDTDQEGVSDAYSRLDL